LYNPSTGAEEATAKKREEKSAIDQAKEGRNSTDLHEGLVVVRSRRARLIQTFLLEEELEVPESVFLVGIQMPKMTVRVSNLMASDADGPM
jgi:hypothetical protein